MRLVSTTLVLDKQIMVAVAFEVPPAGGALAIILDTGGEAPGAEDVAAEGGHHPSGGFQHAGLGVETHRAGDLARRGGRGGDSTGGRRGDGGVRRGGFRRVGQVDRYVVESGRGNE